MRARFARKTAFGVAVMIAMATLASGQAHATANDTGYVVYYVEPSPDPALLYRCATARAAGASWPGTSTAQAMTGQRSGGFCGNDHFVPAGALGVALILVYWNQGAATTCSTTGSSWSTATRAIWFVQLSFATAAPCGQGQYSVTGMHGAVIHGTTRGTLSNSGTFSTP